MAKISPVSIKYMIHANFRVEGALEKPDIIGAIFGQTEGLLGADLEMRELQKEGKIGRIEVEVNRDRKLTTGIIKVPTALDQSETTLVAAAIETIEKIGPCDAQVEIDKIEDVRGNKRDYIIERAKKLMSEIGGTADSREISKMIKDSAKVSSVQKYGDDDLAAGDLSGKEIIVVEGRADVLNLLRAGVKNVIAMNGTKLPETVKSLSKEKDITLFVDGDRGGKLIIKNVLDNARIKYVCIAPDGKEVEELTGKEVLQTLRKKVSVEEYQENSSGSRKSSGGSSSSSKKNSLNPEKVKEKLKKISKKIEGSKKAILFDNSLKEMKRISARALTITLKKSQKKPFAIILDGTVTKSTIKAAERADVKFIVAKNFTTTDTQLELVSF
ncbi:MAG: DNA primase DnaG [Candidatus Pacearchaeota archaeon]